MSVSNMKIPVKPQSVLHRLLRVGKKVEIGKNNLKRRSSASTHSRSTRSDESSEIFSSSSTQMDFCQQPQHEFEIVNQNEFVNNVLILDHCSDTDCIVHFSNESSSLSTDVEEHLLHVLRDKPKRKFELYHINSQMAPYFTKKFNINTEEPTLLRFKNGKLIGRISFESYERCYSCLEQWLKETEQKDDFGSFCIAQEFC